jgi:hypothetical protein
MDVLDQCIYVVNPCMDVVNSCMVLLVMVNEDPRVKRRPCSVCGPTVMLTLYGPRNGFRYYQKEVGDFCKCFNLQHASNPCSDGEHTDSDTIDPVIER